MWLHYPLPFPPLQCCWLSAFNGFLHWVSIFQAALENSHALMWTLVLIFIPILPSLQQHLHFIQSYTQMLNYHRISNYLHNGSQSISISWRANSGLSSRFTKSELLWVRPSCLSCNKLYKSYWCQSNLRAIALSWTFCKDNDCTHCPREWLEYTR